MNLVTVRTFDHYFLANIILTKLHADGVECYLKDEYTVTVDPIISNAIGGIKLVVKKEEEASTLRRLKQYDEEYMNSATCPRCGGNGFSYVAKPGAANYFTALVTWFFSSYALAPEYVYQCGSCNYESANLPETFTLGEFHEN